MKVGENISIIMRTFFIILAIAAAARSEGSCEVSQEDQDWVYSVYSNCMTECYGNFSYDYGSYGYDYGNYATGRDDYDDNEEVGIIQFAEV